MKEERRFPIPRLFHHTLCFGNGLLFILVCQSLVIQVVRSGTICHINLQRNFTVQEPPPLIPIPTYPINSPDCGKHGSIPTTKQVSRLKREQAPWMVLLVIRAQHGAYSYCSGTIITQRHVLTAARCTAYSQQDPLARIDIHYGTEGAFLPAARFLRHPKFDIETLRNDIAILMVDKCFENAGTICLPRSPMNVGQRSTVVFSGVGKRKNRAGGGAIQLLGSTLNVMPAGTCRQKLSATINYKAFFCGVGALTCEVDNSVPVFARRRDGRMVQVGISAYGENCRSRAGVQVFTRVDIHVKWIKRNIDRHEKYEPLALTVL